VLTADRAFIAGRYCEAAYFVRGLDKKAQLQEVRIESLNPYATPGLRASCGRLGFEPSAAVEGRQHPVRAPCKHRWVMGIVGIGWSHLAVFHRAADYHRTRRWCVAEC